MASIRIALLLLAFMVIAECQKRKKFPQSPFLKGGKRRDIVHNDHGHNSDDDTGTSSWNQQWPGFGSQHIDGHNDNHQHGQKTHTHTLGIKMPLGNGRGVGGTCGGKRYAGRTHICCGGEIKRRQGMRPACCGAQVFDFVFDLCCNGQITKRTVSRPVC